MLGFDPHLHKPKKKNVINTIHTGIQNPMY